MKKLLSLALAVALILTMNVFAWGGEVANTGKYKDINPNSWAYEAVNAMSQKGIIKGYSDGSFKPYSIVTYGEFIKMALIADTGKDIGSAPYINEENGKKQNWATSYYNQALEEKYFTKYDITLAQINKPIPRGDMALIISSILGDVKIEDYDGLQSKVSDVNSKTAHDYDIIKTYSSSIITGYEDSTFRPGNTLTRAEAAAVIQRLTDESKRIMPKLGEEKPADTNKTTGTDIGSVIENYKTFGGSMHSGTGSDGVYSEWYEPGDFADATSYEFVTDMSKYKVTLDENMGTKWVDINGKPPLKLGWGNLYLMKDNKLIQMTQDGIYDDSTDKVHTDITTIEYFVFPNYKSEEVPYVQGVGQISHKIGIMPNPFYKGK